MRLAALAQAADNGDGLAVERVLRRSDPDLLFLNARQLSSVMVKG